MENEHLFAVKQYAPDDLKGSAVILHPKYIERYGIEREDVGMIFEQGSNFTRLTCPLQDEQGNFYYDSEAYYMAQRFSDETVKKMIALCSIQANFSKKAAYLLKDQMDTDPTKRIEYMRQTLWKKFSTNPPLATILSATGDRDIIELTYWGDQFFGISHETLSGANILGKLLVETRMRVSQCLK